MGLKAGRYLTDNIDNLEGSIKQKKTSTFQSRSDYEKLTVCLFLSLT